MKTRVLPLILAALALTASALAQTPVAPTASTAAGPEDAVALSRRSAESLRNKDTKTAVELAERATKADPTKADYFAQLGIALSQRMNEVPFMQMAVLSGKLKRAFEKAVALDPNNVAGLIGLARFYANAPEIAGGSLEKAREFANRIGKLVPLQGEIELGHIATKAEDYPEALKHYEAAVALKPDNAGLHLAAGQTLAQLGRKDEARAQFEAALKLKPDFEAATKALADLDAKSAP